MSVGPSVNRGTVGLLFQRFLGAVTRRPDTSAVEDALRTRITDGTEPSTALLLTTLNRMFGRQFTLDGHVPSPADHYGQGLGSLPSGQGYTALGGLGGQPGISATPLGQSLQAAMDEDPAFKEKLEQALGGTLLNSGTPEGRMLVFQASPNTPSPHFAGFSSSSGNQDGPVTRVQPMAVMHAAAQAAGVPGVPSSMGPILTGLQQMEANVKKLALDLSSTDRSQQGAGDFQTFSSGILGQAAQMQLGGGDDGDEDGGGISSMPIGAGMMGQMSGAAGSNVKGLAAQNVAQAALQPVGMSDTMKQQMLQQMMNTLRKFYELLSNILKQMNEMQKTAIDNIK